MTSSNSTKLVRALLSRSTAQVVAKRATIVSPCSSSAACKTAVPLTTFLSDCKRFITVSPALFHSQLPNFPERNNEETSEDSVDQKNETLINDNYHGQNITHNAFMLPHSHITDANDDFRYDEDYDLDNLHMTPSSISSRDGELLSELETVRHEDVVPSDGGGLGGNRSIYFYNDEEDYGFPETQVDDHSYEFEEDWELMHTINCENSGNAGPCEVLDNVDDVNGSVL